MTELAPPAIPVSIIIPVFNDALGTIRCLREIANQTYPLDIIEVVVVDNGSIPPVVIEEVFPFQLIQIRCEIPGSYAARNAGATAASGRVIAFIDADCWPDEDWLRHGVNALLATNGKAIIGGEVLLAAQTKPGAVAIYQQITGFGQESNVREKSFSVTANLFCMRQTFEAVGFFETRLLSGGDREWCWRARYHDIGVNYEPLALVQTEPRTSLQSAIRQARRVVAGRKMLRELGLTHAGETALAKSRSSWQAIVWILSQTDYSCWDRLRVLYVAIVIRLASTWESIRLQFGTTPERR
ncbi:MAG: glycosyltransferase [Ottowia sp.]|uniref:glycosyltransferase n=1 Tax=Ottowia sp. TaxID=1898956 RepID=UPI003C76505B